MELEIVDAHMHLWTPQTHPWVTKAATEGGHPAGSFGKQLERDRSVHSPRGRKGGVPSSCTTPTWPLLMHQSPASVETYALAEYSKDIHGYNVTQSVHVEAVWPGDPVGETRWVGGTWSTSVLGHSRWFSADGWMELLMETQLDFHMVSSTVGLSLCDHKPDKDQFIRLSSTNCFCMYSAIVGHADLSSSDLEDVLQRHCQFTRLRGIRHMLNYHPDKPQYSEPAHDNYLTDPAWIKGFGLLEKYNLSFELHVLPRQMHRCVVYTEESMFLSGKGSSIRLTYPLIGRLRWSSSTPMWWWWWITVVYPTRETRPTWNCGEKVRTCSELVKGRLESKCKINHVLLSQYIVVL